MKRTMSYWTAVFAPVALLPLALGCTSRSTQPTPSTPGMEPGAPSTTQQPGAPQTPQTPQKPTSQMGPEGEVRGEQGRAEQGRVEEQQGAREREGRGREGQQPKPGLGSGIGQPGSPAQGEAGQGAADEKAICDALANSAKLHVEDAQNGVAIVAVPKSGSNLSTVRDDVRRLESAIHAGAGAEPRAGRGETCGVAELARLPSVSVQLIEGTASVRMVMTTSNPGEVKDLRRIARDEIATLSKGGRQPQMQQPHMQQQPQMQQPHMQKQPQQPHMQQPQQKP